MNSGRSYASGNGSTDPGLSGEQSESEAGLGCGRGSLSAEGRDRAGEALRDAAAGTEPLRSADGALTHRSSSERLSSFGGTGPTNSALRAFADICHRHVPLGVVSFLVNKCSIVRAFSLQTR